MSLKPQAIDDNTWYYEYPRYMLVVHWVVKDGRRQRADSFKIYWRNIRKSLTRVPKPKKRIRASV